MKKLKITTTFFIVTALLFSSWDTIITGNFNAQSEQSSVIIKGTSNLHDWEMKLENITCQVSLQSEDPVLILEKVYFSGEAKSLQSESSIMDKKAHSALKSEEYPQIKFSLTTSQKIQIINGTFKGTATGNLTVAGVTKNVSFPFTGKINDKNEVIINGSEKIDMTQFGIEPPTALMGSLKTGKDINVSFSINLKQV